MIFISPLGRAPGGGERERSGSTRKASSPPFSLALSLSLSFFSFLPGAFVCVAGLMWEGGGRRWRRRSAAVFVCIATERGGSGGGETARLLEGGEHVCSCIISYASPPSPESRGEGMPTTTNARVCCTLQLGPRKKGRLGDRREDGGTKKGGGKRGRRYGTRLLIPHPIRDMGE